MINFLYLKTEEVVTPPEIITRNLGIRFYNPLNIEWSKQGDIFEAIFYFESTEHIAEYSNDGSLISFRVNISPGLIPEDLKQRIEPGYEIMNIVKRVSGDGLVTYEIITRDKELKRYLMNSNADNSSVEIKTL